jgi:hypothetical protein
MEILFRMEMRGKDSGARDLAGEMVRETRRPEPGRQGIRVLVHGGKVWGSMESIDHGWLLLRRVSRSNCRTV